MKKLLLFVCLALGAGASCRTIPAITIELSNPTATRTAIPPTASHTPTHTPTPSPSASPTAAPTATHPPTPTATALPAAVVAAETLKLRTGPGEDYPVAGLAAAGDDLSLRARTGDAGWIGIGLNPGSETAWAPAGALALPEGYQDWLPASTDFPPPPPEIKYWQGDPVQVVCIDLRGEYTWQFTGDHPETAFQPGDPNWDAIDQETQRYLSELSLNPANETPGCHATLLVEMTIRYLGARYASATTGEITSCYSGTSVSGKVTLYSETERMSYTYSKVRPNALKLTGCPQESPVLGESSYVILKGIQALWGDDVLRAGLKSDREDIKRYTLSEIAALGLRGRQFTPDLVALLPDETLAAEAAGTLKAVTGFNFGTNPDAWMEWWESVTSGQ